MNRRKKRETQCPDQHRPAGVNYPATVKIFDKWVTQHEYICEGCTRVSENLECTIYPNVPSVAIRLGCCFFNRPEVKAKKRKTVGQQKQGRNR